jgi:hypothetical protein
VEVAEDILSMELMDAMDG